MAIGKVIGDTSSIPQLTELPPACLREPSAPAHQPTGSFGRTYRGNETVKIVFLFISSRGFFDSEQAGTPLKAWPHGDWGSFYTPQTPCLEGEGGCLADCGSCEAAAAYRVWFGSVQILSLPSLVSHLKMMSNSLRTCVDLMNNRWDASNSELDTRGREGCLRPGCPGAQQKTPTPCPTHAL